MNVYAKLIEIARESARRSNRNAVTHVFVSQNGKPYEFDDYGKLIGEYLGGIPCKAAMPPELEKQVALSGK